MADQLGKRIGFRGQQGLALDNKVVVSGRIEGGHEVHRDRPGGRVVVRRRELVDDGRYVGGRVLRRLGGLCNFRRY